MKNSYKDIGKAELDAQQALKDAQDRIQEIEKQKQQKVDEEKAALVEKRITLFNDAKELRDNALIAVKSGDFTRAESLKGFAEELEKQAREIIIEGEVVQTQEPENNPMFDEGMSLKKVMLLLSFIVTGLYFLTGYINHLVELGESSVSISLGAEWIHAIQTTQFWSVCWLVSFGMLALTNRPISRFMNPKDDPHFDLTTKLFTECTASFQIAISMLLLLSMVFSWCMIYLHSPVSNAG